MEAEDARKHLVAQHEQIRSHLVQCSALAQRLRDGEPVRVELDATLARMRADLAEHNSTETNLIGLLLHGTPGWGSVLIDRMRHDVRLNRCKMNAGRRRPPVDRNANFVRVTIKRCMKCGLRGSWKIATHCICNQGSIPVGVLPGRIPC